MDKSGKSAWSQKVKGWSVKMLTSEYSSLRQWFSLQPEDVKKILASKNISEPCIYSYTTMMLMAISMSDKWQLGTTEIMEWITDMFPEFRGIMKETLASRIRPILYKEEYFIKSGSKRWTLYSVDPWLQQKMKTTAFYKLAKAKLVMNKEETKTGDLKQKKKATKTLNETDILDLVELRERRTSSRLKPNTSKSQDLPDKGQSIVTSPIPLPPIMLPMDDNELVPNMSIRMAQQKRYSETMSNATGVQTNVPSPEKISSPPLSISSPTSAYPNPLTSDPIVTIENLEDDMPDPSSHAEILKISPKKGERRFYKHAVESHPLVVLKDVMSQSIDEIYKDTLRMQSSAKESATTSMKETDTMNKHAKQPSLTDYHQSNEFSSYTGSSCMGSALTSDVISPTQNSPYVQAQPVSPFVPLRNYHTKSPLQTTEVSNVYREEQSVSNENISEQFDTVSQSPEKQMKARIVKGTPVSQNGSNSQVVPTSNSPKPVALYKAERRVVKDRGKKSTSDENFKSSKSVSLSGNSSISQSSPSKQVETSKTETKKGVHESSPKFSSGLLSQASQGIKLSASAALRGFAKNYSPYPSSVKRSVPESDNTSYIQEAQINEITSSSDLAAHRKSEDRSVTPAGRKKFKGNPSEKEDNKKNVITGKSQSNTSRNLKNAGSDDVINLCDDDEDDSGDDIQIVGETKTENVPLQSRLTVQRIGDVVFENIAIVRNKDYESDSDNDSVQIID